MQHYPTQTSAFSIEGVAGQIEMITTWPSQLSSQTVAIICHPHPLFQGSMKNKVVTTLFRTFDRLGMPAVRFNFRGVGNSEGEYAQGLGEQDDLEAVLTWVATRLIDYKVVLCGFSFGAYIAGAVANREPVQGLITVAPPVHHFAFKNLSRVRCPWLVVMGDQDEIVPIKEVEAFVEQPPAKLDYRVLTGASHFFHGQIVALADTLAPWISDQFLS